MVKVRPAATGQHLRAGHLAGALAEGVLAGGATAICGASAALALAAVLPRGPDKERFTLLVMVAVTALSTLAMLVIPLGARGMHLSPAQAGLFLGASIHDIAQVVASGLMLSESTGTVATIMKLLRVSLLVVVVTAVPFVYRKDRGDAGRLPLPPWFLGVFMLLAGIQSAGWIAPLCRHTSKLPPGCCSRWLSPDWVCACRCLRWLRLAHDRCTCWSA